MGEQYHYDFKDWEDAFRQFYRKRCGERLTGDGGEALGFRKGNPRLVFVVSTAPEVSGYWIEEGAEPDAQTAVYKSVRAVRALEARIRHAREGTVNLSLGGVVR